MPPSPVVVDVPTAVAASPNASLTFAESAPKLMPATVIGISNSSGFFAKRVPKHRLGCALLAIALERISRHGRRQKHQIIKGGNPTLGSEAANIVEARFGGLVDVGEHLSIERGTLFESPAGRMIGVRHWPVQWCDHPGMRCAFFTVIAGQIPHSTRQLTSGGPLVVLRAIDVPMVQRARGCHTLKTVRIIRETRGTTRDPTAWRCPPARAALRGHPFPTLRSCRGRRSPLHTVSRPNRGRRRRRQRACRPVP